jgi:hypothetical protein
MEDHAGDAAGQPVLPFLVLDEDYCAAVLESGAMQDGGTSRRCVRVAGPAAERVQ